MTRSIIGTRSSRHSARRSTRTRCAASASSSTNCRTTCRAGTRDNDYGFDPHEQEHTTYTGMGTDINVHDQWACESMGAIQDRTEEHLGTSDKAISAYRRLLRQALEQSGKGERPMMVLDAARSREDHRPGLRRRHRPGRRIGRAIGRAPTSTGRTPKAGPTGISVAAWPRANDQLRKALSSVTVFGPPNRRARRRPSRNRSSATSSNWCAFRLPTSTACCAARLWWPPTR